MDRSIVLNIRGGAKVCVPGDLEQITPYVLLEQEDWFEHEIRFARKLLAPGGRAVDIGANYGLYTLALAAGAGPQGRVWACEPTPRTADYLEQSLALNKQPQVQLLRLAVSDRAGPAHLTITENPELNSLAAGSAPGTIEVPAARLDNLASEFAWQDIDFVKIDVEGHELAVIEGGEVFFKTQSPLVMFEITSDAGTKLHPITRFRSLGYRMYRLVPGPGLLAPITPGESLDPYTLNLFCCKPDRAQALQRAGLLADGGAPSASAHAVPEDALSCHRAASNASENPDSRLWLLRRALESASRDSAAGSLPALMTHARIASDWGERQLALRNLKIASKSLLDRWQDAARVPFLPPDERFDSIAPDGNERDRIVCAFVEGMAALTAHSSIFAGESLLPMLELVASNPFQAPRTVRCRQLVRMRAGMQAGPEPHPLLAEPSELNLNSWYWQGNR